MLARSYWLPLRNKKTSAKKVIWDELHCQNQQKDSVFICKLLNFPYVNFFPNEAPENLQALPEQPPRARGSTWPPSSSCLSCFFVSEEEVLRRRRRLFVCSLVGSRSASEALKGRSCTGALSPMTHNNNNDRLWTAMLIWGGVSVFTQLTTFYQQWLLLTLNLTVINFQNDYRLRLIWGFSL